MNPVQSDKESVRQGVREVYGRLVEEGRSCGCAPSCCSPAGGSVGGTSDAESISKSLGYSPEQLAAVPQGANLGLGCGNPQAIAALKPGEVVLDLGSGAGFDAFLAAGAVGVGGRVIGVDMTPGMVEKARRNLAAAGFGNVEFRIGEIENLPVADATVDVILSNCVINLSPDKPRVFQEAFRVLRPGGRLAVSDIVALGPIPDEVRRDWELYSGCVAGAATVDEAEAMLEAAGFRDVRISPKAGSAGIVGGWFPGRSIEDHVASANIEATKPLDDR